MSAAEKVEAEGSTSCPSAEHGEEVDGRRDAAEDGVGVADDATGEGEGGGEREGVPIEELGQLLLSEGGSVEEDGVTDHDGPGSAIVSKEGDDGDDGASQSEEGFALPRPPSVPGLGDEEAESVPTAAADGPDLCGVVGEVASLVPADTLAGIMRLQQNVLGNLRSTNKTVTDFNIFSEEKYASVSPELTKLAKNLKAIKSDLDYIYKKTSALKGKLKAKHPECFA